MHTLTIILTLTIGEAFIHNEIPTASYSECWAAGILETQHLNRVHTNLTASFTCAPLKEQSPARKKNSTF